MDKPLIFRQLFDADSSTYTYLLADPISREAVLIDPVFEQHLRDRALIEELDLTLLCTLDTHCHAGWHVGLEPCQTTCCSCLNTAQLLCKQVTHPKGRHW